ncbi:uracil-DNA glycosylase family protein [Clostridium sp.]|uniref:uracil-DNA glycosylase family protein n=1 Tax=Clostridium sp. TaxID=1506 RepID=UPI003D6D338D
MDNAYVTNAVKCGTESGDNTRKYCKETVNICVTTHLLKEIEVLQPKVIFAFGRQTSRIIRKAPQNSNVIYLPHPAARVSNLEMRRSYSYGVLEALCNASVIKKDSTEYGELITLFESAKCV